ncbi:uncharacterized protein EDB93DRAFT_1094950 [Suillus bovinus]|uniref:uncharacterized protein n=1 Tax=Suillus bovinus TaxID=48563 RepID=UPI001B87C6C1|nr:uncharacterized protein EDB93DRAFT_1094950 [Suillus bovinus]KAG2130314.1 hypothetical protein EDB93DRAFT_1094950 [Suillus bovinus]
MPSSPQIQSLSQLGQHESEGSHFPQKHDSLYLFDGNIILMAPTKAGGTTLFRVHQSILSNHSPIFANMLKSSISDEGQMYDGIRLVRLTDDAEEIESLFKLIYIPSPLILSQRLSRHVPPIVRHVLKLSNKYEMSKLRQAVVQVLETQWPTSLAQWDRLEGEIAAMAWDQDYDHTPLDLDRNLPEPALAIRLGREFHVPSIMPAAFYHLSRLSIGHSLHIPRDAVRQRTADWNLLTAADLICLIMGKEGLSMVAASMLMSDCSGDETMKTHWAEGDCRGCRRSQIMEQIHWECKRTSDVLSTLRRYLTVEPFPWSPICETCSCVIKNQLRKVRQTLWAMLPLLFQHASLYFFDGNIALTASNNFGEQTVFRVHQSLLSHYSTVFADMLSLPLEQEAETYDDVPLVCLPDNAEEIESLLKAIYFPRFPPLYPHLTRCAPRAIYHLLNLSNKYEINELRHEVVQQLEADWPTSLARWDRLEGEIAGLIDSDGDSMCPEDPLPDPASAIQLARECQVPTILPAAFYHLSRLSIRCQPDKPSRCKPWRRTANWGLLTARDLRCLLLGREGLRQVTDSMLTTETGDVESQIHWMVDRCRGSQRIEVMNKIREECQSTPDVLATLRGHATAEKLLICHICHSWIRDRLKQVRHALWTKLPTLFQLED